MRCRSVQCTRNGRLERPIVADPEGTEINQAFLAYRTSAGTTKAWVMLTARFQGREARR